MGVSPATISRELAHNRLTPPNQPQQAEYAQQQAHQRTKRTPYKLKGPLLERVKTDLRQRWSPEQISGRREAEQGGQASISHETIYQMIYSQPTGSQKLTKYLRIRHRKHYKKRGQPARRSKIPNRVSIDVRPAIVETNTEVGHWEGDTIIGFDQDGVLLTIVERVTKFTTIAKLPTRKAEPLAKTAIVRLSQCPLPVKSLTLDNGLEFASHEQITAQIGMAVFFAHPYHSWERAGRLVLSQGEHQRSDSSVHPQGATDWAAGEEFVSSIETDLNHRPGRGTARKALGFLSLSNTLKNNKLHFKPKSAYHKLLIGYE
ncbi:MAG: IS30 family transposase [Spirosoma sp.]|nr:IS30 family transposase [Spirosoma sp.]